MNKTIPTPLDPAIESLGSIYMHWIPIMRDIAKTHGYAIAVHGSMQRDCDLIAIPWIQEASAPITMIKAIRDAIGGCYLHPERDEKCFSDGNPSKKPHGRLGYIIHMTTLGGLRPYFDISVIPPTQQ